MKRIITVCAVIIIALFSFAFVPARVTHPQHQQTYITDVKKQDINDLQGLKKFVDEYATEKMPEEKVPGMAVSVVKDGKIYFQQSYGYADIDKKRPVVLDKTLFRVASISKLFTATAVMQLVEQGKINLSSSVNDYIKNFQLAHKYPQQITVANLLTHTSGLDVNDIGMSARSAKSLQPLGQNLANRKPLQIVAPGTMTTYSNYGMALAGYIVEQVSGVPFAEYIDKNILQPLGMRQSSFLQPPPLTLQSDLAKGYEYENNQYAVQPYTYEHQVPAIALSTTATDIAKFMIAHLNSGRLNDKAILKPDTIKEMHRQHFTSDARIPGIAYGFQEQFRNNLRILRHGGLIEGFVSQLVLIPKENVGVFVVCNSTSTLDTDFIREFLNRYYPIQNKPHLAGGKSLAELNYLKGDYLDTITSQTTIQKIIQLYYFNVEIQQNNTLVYDSRQYIQIEPMLFVSLEGDRYISFRKNPRDHKIYLFDGVFTLRQMSWYESISLHILLYKLFFTIFIVVCMWQPFKLALIYFHSNYKLFSRASLSYINIFIETSRSRAIKLTKLLVSLIAYINLLFIVVGRLLIAHKESTFLKLIYGVNPVIVILLSLPIISGGMTVITTFYICWIWRKKEGGYLQRLYYTIVTGAAILFILFLDYWNLLGFRF
jgi:CubicO group peptidase (beta-lactamase class C family)